MTAYIDTLQEELCRAFCADIVLAEIEGHIAVPLPLSARDGDGIVVYLDRTPAGWRVSDLGTTMMRLSYENDLTRLLSGSRLKLFQSILAESGASEDDGEIYAEVPADKLMSGIFAVGQAASRVGDISLWTRTRAESTFFDDLRERIYSSVQRDRVTENYRVEGLPSADDYVVDFKIETDSRPLYIMGVHSRDRARLATITFQHLRSHQIEFEGMAVLSKLEDVGMTDLRRLMTAADQTVPGIDNPEIIRQKIQHFLPH